MNDGTSCERCAKPTDHSTEFCCSSHGKRLCHDCYLRTHFVHGCTCGLCASRAAVPSPAAPTGQTFPCPRCGMGSWVCRCAAPAAPTEPAAEEMVSVRRPWIDHDGGRPISFDLREAADRVEAMRIWGSNKKAGIARLLRDVADASAVRAVVSDTEQGGQ